MALRRYKGLQWFASCYWLMGVCELVASVVGLCGTVYITMRMEPDQRWITASIGLAVCWMLFQAGILQLAMSDTLNLALDCEEHLRHTASATSRLAATVEGD
jgi:hypothetical protein